MTGPYPPLSRPSRQQIYDRLCVIASDRLTLPAGALVDLHPSASLVDGLQLDSLAQVTFLAALEVEFGVMLEAEDRDDIVTVDDLVSVIQSRLEESPAAASQRA